MERTRMMSSGHQMSLTDKEEILKSASAKGGTRENIKVGTRLLVVVDFTVDRIKTMSGGLTISTIKSIGSMRRNSSDSRRNSLGNKRRHMRGRRLQIANQTSKRMKP